MSPTTITKYDPACFEQGTYGFAGLCARDQGHAGATHQSVSTFTVRGRRVTRYTALCAEHAGVDEKSESKEQSS